MTSGPQITMEDRDKCPDCGSNRFLDLPRRYVENWSRIAKQSKRRLPRQRQCQSCGRVYLPGATARRPGILRALEKARAASARARELRAEKEGASA